MVEPKICNNNDKQPSVPDFCDFGDWEVPVKNLSDIKEPNRDHAYILPDNSVWVLSHDGKTFIAINNSGGNGNTQPTQFNNTDGYLHISGSGTYNVTTDLNTEKVVELVKEKVEIPQITIATDKAVGIVKPDNRTITVDEAGTLTVLSDNSKYINKSDAVLFDETGFFAIEDSNVIKQDQTVYFSVNLISILAFSFPRNAKFKIGKLIDPDLFPKTRLAVNMVTENPTTAIYANTAITIEKNGDIMLVNTSDVGIGSAYNFRLGNTHLINLTYVTV